MKITLLLFALLWFDLGCHTQIQSGRRDPTHDTQENMEIPVSATANPFGRSLSRTILKFGLDDCLSTFRDINRAIDKLTVRTQPDYWEFVKQRYARSKVRYAELREDWSEAVGRSAPEPASIPQSLTELESVVVETDERLERRDNEYAQQRRQYELHRRQQFTELKSAADERELTAQRRYADAEIDMGFSAMDVTLTHVLLTLEVYASRPGTSVSEDEILSPKNEGLSSIEGLEDYIHLVDQQNRDLGPPQAIQYDRLHSIDGLVVTLAFVRDPTAERTPIQLRINPSPLGNAEPVVLAVPAEQESDRLARALEQDVLLGSAQPDDSASTDTGIQIIRCQRENMHLKVPVQVDIHGVEVKTAMLLDTGASVTVLSKSVYQRGLTRPMTELKTMRLTTGNGPVTCPVDTLRVSTTAYARSLPVAMTDGSTSLLGANYFAGRRFTVDLDRECIYVHSK